MPINVWTPFRADLYESQGAGALGAGIGGGIASLGDALAKALEQKKQRNQLAKASAAFFKSSPDLQAHLGISPEDYEGLSADDKIDATTSGVASLRLHTDLEEARQQGQVREAQLSEFLAKQNERQSMTDIAGQLSQQGPAPEAVPAPLSNAEFDRRTAPPDLMSAIAKLGPGRGLEPRAAADLADSLARMRAMGGPAPIPPVPEGMETSSVTYDAYGRPSTTYRRPKDETEKEPIISIGVGAPNLMGDYPNKLRITPSQLKKHREALAELGFNLPAAESEAPPKIPTVGSVEDGFRFKGGNPADPKNWEKVK